MTDPTTDPIEGTPPSASTDQPSDKGATETVESLKVKLAAAEKEKLEAQAKADEWKGRVKEENPKKKKEETPDDYADWRIDNKDRLSVAGVKDAYEKELQELEQNGSKVSNAIREKALKLAESTIGVKKAEPSSQPLPSGMVDRGGSAAPTMTNYDTQFGVNPETKKKWAHVVEA